MVHFVYTYTKLTVVPFRKYAIDPNQTQRNDGIRFIVHGVAIGEPLRAPAGGGLSRLKPLLAQRVKGQLEDPNSEFYVEKLCDCRMNRTKIKKPTEDVDREVLNDEKEEEFAILGVLELREVDGESEDAGDGDNEEGEEEERPKLEQQEDVELKKIEDHKEDIESVLDTSELMEVDYKHSTEEEEDLYFEEVVERMLFG